MSNRREDLDYCEQAIKNGSLSFHAASRLLPNAVRNSCLALYAFCRLADDEVDLKEDKSASVYDLVERLDKVYSGSPRDLPMDRAFARMVEETEMPRALPEALIEGLVWDAMERPRSPDVSQAVTAAFRDRRFLPTQPSRDDTLRRHRRGPWP